MILQILSEKKESPYDFVSWNNGNNKISKVVSGEKMSDKRNIDYIYKQNLETSIIEYLAERKHIELRQAMHIYYQSRLAEQIEQGMYGIENMDYKYLAEDLIENEPELFS